MWQPLWRDPGAMHHLSSGVLHLRWRACEQGNRPDCSTSKTMPIEKHNMCARTTVANSPAPLAGPTSLSKRFSSPHTHTHVQVFGQNTSNSGQGKRTVMLRSSAKRRHGNRDSARVQCPQCFSSSPFRQGTRGFVNHSLQLRSPRGLFMGRSVRNPSDLWASYTTGTCTPKETPQQHTQTIPKQPKSELVVSLVLLFQQQQAH